MTLLEAINSGKIVEAPDDFFMIRDAHLEHIKNPTYRLRAPLLHSGVQSLESDDGDGYRFTNEDITAEDWLVLPNESIGEVAA